VIYYALLSFFVLEYVRPGAYVPGLDALHLNAIVPLTCIIGTLVMKTPVSSRDSLRSGTRRSWERCWSTCRLDGVCNVTLFAYEVTKTVFSYIIIYWILVRQVGDLRRLKGVFITLTAAHIIIAAQPGGILAAWTLKSVLSNPVLSGRRNDFSLSVNICIPLCLFLMAESKKIRSSSGPERWCSASCHPVARGTVGSAVGLYWLKSPRKLLTAALFVLVVAIVMAWAPAS
jgi:hypothetical protein